jgi:thiol-disulfide isomerase/thioredoxin
MKKLFLLLLSFCVCSPIAFAQKSKKQTQFIITANIKGMKDGAKVRLVNHETYHESRTPIAQSVVKNHSFRLVGYVDSPTLCQLQIDDKVKIGKGEYMLESGTDIFVENVPIKVSAAHYDSIPKAYEYNSTPLFKEKNVTITGGSAQRTFAEYRSYIYDLELSAWKCDWEYRSYVFFNNNKNPDEKVVEKLKQALADAQAKVSGANDRFVVAHPSYPVSLWLVQQKLENHFTYSNAQFNSWLSLLKSNTDKKRYSLFVKQVEAAKKFAKGTHYTDFAVLTTDSVTKKLSDYISRKGYTLVDFWASWCGPCRLSIPHVKQIYAKYSRDMLNVISISCDKDNKEWLKAVGEEQMPWVQLVLAKESMKLVKQAYQLSGIPYLLLINDNGELIFASNSSDEMTAELKELLK